MHIHAQIFVGMYVFISLVNYLGVKLLSDMVSLTL